MWKKELQMRSYAACVFILIVIVHLCRPIELDIVERVHQKITLCTNGTRNLTERSALPEQPSILTKISDGIMDIVDNIRGSDVRGRRRRSVHLLRLKRSLDLVFPGTKWCGQGNIAQNYSDLGINVFTDKCCRGHDNCPHSLEAFESKYGLYNPEMYTRSDCVCEVLFRNCLHAAKCFAPVMRDRFAAGIIGELYFTEMITYCIRFPQKSCLNFELCSHGPPHFERNKVF